MTETINSRMVGNPEVRAVPGVTSEYAVIRSQLAGPNDYLTSQIGTYGTDSHAIV